MSILLHYVTISSTGRFNAALCGVHEGERQVCCDHVYTCMVCYQYCVYFSADSVVHFLKTSSMYGLVEINNWLVCVCEVAKSINCYIRIRDGQYSVFGIRAIVACL